jgi:hypothetical protein
MIEMRDEELYESKKEKNFFCVIIIIIILVRVKSGTHGVPKLSLVLIGRLSCVYIKNVIALEIVI